MSDGANRKVGPPSSKGEGGPRRRVVGVPQAREGSQGGHKGRPYNTIFSQLQSYGGGARNYSAGKASPPRGDKPFRRPFRLDRYGQHCGITRGLLCKCHASTNSLGGDFWTGVASECPVSRPGPRPRDPRPQRADQNPPN